MTKLRPVLPTVIASLTALVGPACVSESTPEDSQPRPRATTLEVSKVRAAACDPGRRVARLEVGGSCPSVDGWGATKMFTGNDGDLDHYCIYQHEGVGELNPADLDAVTSAHDPDCFGIFPQTENPDLASLVAAEPLQQAFHLAINRASDTDLNLASNEIGRKPVMVAVIDTIPNPEPAAPRSEHGGTVAALIRDIACPATNSPCAVEVRNRLGMPRVEEWGVDPVNGGFYGAQSDLARAIYYTVLATPSQSKLVINLSLGWEPEFFGEQRQSSVPVEAVYAAIEFARCHGALVIAAAGNQGFSCEQGPLMPGGWEVDPAPTEPRCVALGVDSPALINDGYAPLLYAVGGLGYDAAPMPATRLGSMPLLAATAMHAVADVDAPRSPLSGTSVSAAAVSGAAGLVWSFYPKLTPNQVMQSLYLGGDSLGTPADVLLTGSPITTTHALDVCGAVNHASARPDTIPLPAPLSCLSAPAPDLAPVFAVVEAEATASSQPVFSAPTPTSCAGGCMSGPSFPADDALDTCPTPVALELPYTTPQPTHPACPSCTIDTGEAMVYASIAEDFDYPILDVLITAYANRTPYYLPLGPIELSSTAVTEISLDPGGIPATVDSATITITFDDPTQPLINESQLIVE